MFRVFYFITLEAVRCRTCGLKQWVQWDCAEEYRCRNCTMWL